MARRASANRGRWEGMSEALRPCPFCGSQVTSPPENEAWVWHHDHSWCPLSMRGFTTLPRWWNRRADATDVKALRKLRGLLADSGISAMRVREALAFLDGLIDEQK